MRFFRVITLNLVCLAMMAGNTFAISIGGTVADDGGTGIAGVEVRVFETGGAHFDLTTTNGSGAYFVEDLVAGTYVVWTRNEAGYIDELFDNIVCAGGCNYFAGTPVIVAQGNDASGIDFELRNGGRISGVVTDESAGVLDAVDIQVFDADGDLITTGVTDMAGAYLSPSGLPTGDYFVRTRNDQGFFDELWDDIGCPGDCDPLEGTIIEVTEGAITPDIDFALSPGAQISGTVTSTGDGAPITAVRIDVYDGGGSWVSSSNPDGTGQWATEAGLAAGNYFALTDNWWGHVDELWDDIPCSAGCVVTDGTPIVVTGGVSVTGVDFALDPGGWINGTLTDTSTGLPVGEAGVEVFNASGTRVMTAFAGDDGVYWGSGLPTGEYFLRAYSWAGYLSELYDDIPCWEGCDPVEGTPVSVTAPDITYDIDFALSLGGSITGTITEENSGNPVVEADVIIFDGLGDPIVWVMPDPLGNFDSGAIPEGSYFVLVDSWDDWQVDEVYDDLACADFCDPEDGTPIAVTVGGAVDLDIELAIGGMITGSVTAVDGGALVVDCEMRLFDPAGDWVALAFTDEEGAFEFTAIPEGQFFLVTHNFDNLVDLIWQDLECPGNCDPTTGVALNVQSGVVTDGIDFALESAALMVDGFESGDTSAWD